MVNRGLYVLCVASGLRWRQQWRLWCLGVCLLACAACAAKEPKLVETEPAVSLPEVTRIVLQGNTTFGSGELRKEMATKQRPLLPPWKRGEPYNPPTVEADLRRLKKFYFDRGFLDTTVTLGQVQEDAEARTVQLDILIEEGQPTLVQAVHVEGTVPPEIPAVDTLLAELPLHAGERLTRANFEKSKDLLLLRLHDAGYARAQLVPRTEVDPQLHRATVTFQVYPGTPHGVWSHHRQRRATGQNACHPPQNYRA